MKKTAKIAAAVAGALLIVIIAASCFKIIPTGCTGVKSTFGQISEKPLSPGFAFKAPFAQRIECVNNKQQDYTAYSKIWAETNERTAIYFENIIVTYQISSEYSAWLVANVTNYRDSIITEPVIASAVKTSSKVFTDIDATNRGKIEPEAQKCLQNILDQKYGENAVIINRVTISNIDFDESYNAAIAEKQNAQLAYEKQAIENKTAVEKAEAEAQAKEKEAEGEAKAIKIKAEAEAEANRKIADSLTDNVLANKFYEKWDGKLPTVTGDTQTILPSDIFD